MKLFKILFIVVLSIGMLLLISCGGEAARQSRSLFMPPPVDPQIVLDQDDMTWDDYTPIPGRDWNDPSLVPERGFRMALVAVDFPDQPFVITLPKGSDLFGNPVTDPITRDEVPQFYSDFWLKPSVINHGQTINGYWMEQSRGAFGITALDPYGPYRMPKNLWEYGLSEHGQNEFTPDGSVAGSRMEPDVDALWRADAGDIKESYDAVLRLYAGYDETGVWQEFGEMRFMKDEIPAEWGNPDTTMPRWAPTRYVEWTSWRAAMMQWGLSSIRQGENSGTITHELGHYAFRIKDNANNPYVTPYRRSGSGPWDMMDRGCFNGPGGPHMRWVVPPVMGASMPAGLMLRNRMKNRFIDEEQVFMVSREGLAESGVVVVDVTSRAVEPHDNEWAGVIITLDGDEPHDRTPPEDPATNPLSAGLFQWDFYTVEVVQRIGFDSFCPDNGVLIAKNRELEERNGGPNEFICFNWVIDAHPEDIGMVDFVRPDGTRVMRSIADYRQLNDALFHAGTDSGSEFEYVDQHNNLHFYILDMRKDRDGIISYRVAVRSSEGGGPHRRGVTLSTPESGRRVQRKGVHTFVLENSGMAHTLKGDIHGQKSDGNCNFDIYRLTLSVEGEGWEAGVQHEVVAVRNGESIEVPVYIGKRGKGAGETTITLKAVSESDPQAAASCAVRIY